MAEGFDADSPQGFLMHSAKGAAGTTIRLADAQGRELLSEEIPCSFSSAVISAPALKIGDICTIEVDGAQEQVTIDNSSEAGFMAMSMRGGGMRGGRRQGDRKPSDKPEINRPGRQEMPGNGERPFEPGEVQQGQGSALILLGISILALLSGLLMAMKIKY
ncbi:MAG: hypothetical protein K2M70_13220 [Lachnospiraceae bacterium]|nr:hypothetical protein [Lachnospiraceae bacterium]